MKFTGAIALVFAAAVSAETLSWDAGYDNGARGMDQVACSDGANGFLTKGINTQSQVPGFPNIGGTSRIAGWNSAQCGFCYRVDYNGRSVFIRAVDSASSAINMSKAAMNTLTNGQAEALGRIEGTVTQVDTGSCGTRAAKRDAPIAFNA